MEDASVAQSSDLWWEVTSCEKCRQLVRLNLLRCAELKYVDEAFAHIRRCPIFNKGRQHVGNGAPSGLFAFTLTKSPKDPLTVGDMLAAVRKVMAQKSCPVKRYAWYYEDKGRDEFGDPIHPHFHGIYETESGGRIERKHWKRAWSIWDENKPMGAGFQGGYHRPVKAEEGYKDYIKKDGRMSETKGMDELTE